MQQHGALAPSHAHCSTVQADHPTLQDLPWRAGQWASTARGTWCSNRTFRSGASSFPVAVILSSSDSPGRLQRRQRWPPPRVPREQGGWPGWRWQGCQKQAAGSPAMPGPLPACRPAHATAAGICGELGTSEGAGQVRMCCTQLASMPRSGNLYSAFVPDLGGALAAEGWRRSWPTLLS